MKHQDATIETPSAPMEPEPARELLVYMRLAEQEDRLRNVKPETTERVRPQAAVDQGAAAKPQRSERARFNLD